MEPCYIEKYGTITYNLRIRTVPQLAYPLISSAMRLTLVLLLLSDSTTIQIFVYRISFLLYYIYVCQVKP